MSPYYLKHEESLHFLLYSWQSVFRNQPEFSPLYVLDASDITKSANNDSKNGKGKQTNNKQFWVKLKAKKAGSKLWTLKLNLWIQAFME